MTTSLLNVWNYGFNQQSGYPPQLFLVAAGSYASTPLYGSGAIATGNYNDVTIRGSSNSLNTSKCVWQRNGNEVTFEVIITLDGSKADPFGATPTNEVRIGPVYPPVSGLGQSVRPNLPIPNATYQLPLFSDVEIRNQTNTELIPTASLIELQSRMLCNGDLAIILKDLNAAPPTNVIALTAGDLAPFFGGAAGSTIRISVRGTYMAV